MGHGQVESRDRKRPSGACDRLGVMGADGIRMEPYTSKKAAATSANINQLRKIHGITCAFSGCVGNCEDLAGKYGEFVFDACPISVISSRRWTVIFELFGASKVSPLSDWPEGWAPWIVRGLSDLRAAIDTATAQAQKEALKNGRI